MTSGLSEVVKSSAKYFCILCVKIRYCELVFFYKTVNYLAFYKSGSSKYPDTSTQYSPPKYLPVPQLLERTF